MRTTLLAILPVIGACAPIGGQCSHTGTCGDSTPDAGTTATSNCDGEQEVTADWTINSATAYGTPPTTCYHLKGTLTLQGSAITTLAKLGDIRAVDDLVIDSTALAKIDSSHAITVNNSLTITNNSKLTGLANLSFDGVTQLASLTVENNNLLVDAGSLAKVKLVTGATAIDGNPALTTLDLSQVARAEGGLAIHDNAALQAIKLDALTSVTGTLQIKNNTVLNNLGDWAALQYVHGVLDIENNNALVSLDQTMTGNIAEIFQLTISNNPNLQSVGQLAHTGYFDTTFVFQNNPSLSYCAIREIGCCVSHTGDTVTGNFGTSCNSGPHSWCYAQNGNTCPYQY